MVDRDIRAVYCVEGGAQFTFQRASNKGCVRFLEATVHPDHLAKALSGEYALLGLPDLNFASYGRSRLIDEINLADRIITQSEFAAGTYRMHGVANEKLRVVPLGVDLTMFSPSPERRPEADSALRVLYVGQLSVRKGVIRLIEALNGLKENSVQLRMIGLLDSELRLSFNRLLSNSRVHIEWIPGVARYELPVHYRWADLLALPSLCDSFGQVVLEAMACGTPVLVTSACGAPVADGVDGWVVPSADNQALTDKVALAVSLNRSKLAELGNNAARHAARYSWQGFAARMLAVLSEPMQMGSPAQPDVSGQPGKAPG